eukprot:symbB.v1.2.011218.t1/scaffold737.1/size167444/5
MGMPGMPPSMPMNTAPTNTSQAMDEQANQRLGRLETALLALKPQIEAMVTIQSKQLTSPATSNSIPAARGLPLTGSQTPSAEKDCVSFTRFAECIHFGNLAMQRI